MRSHIVVVDINGWLVPYAYYTSKLYALQEKIHQYKRYFPDAKIASSPKILSRRVFKDYRVNKRIINRVNPTPQAIFIENQHYIPQAQTYIIKEPIPIITPTPIYRVEAVLPQIKDIPIRSSQDIDRSKFDKKMLSGHNFYLAYKSPDDRNNLLIKLSFGTFDVKYQPIVGDMDMREAKYIVEKGRLYMFADTFSEDGAYSKIEDVKDDYMVISSWFGGKKINTLRYYYSLDKAKEYLGENSSNKLVNALEDKSFDRVEQAFIGVDGVYIRSDDEDW
jgi:hypothetical protein